MQKSIRTTHYWLLLIPFCILAITLLLIAFPLFSGQNEAYIYKALGIDLAITLPLSYLLISHKAKFPKTFAIPLFILGITLGSLLIPSAYQSPLSFIKTWILPLLELTILTVLIRKVIALRKAYKRETKNEFYSDFLIVSTQLLPKFLANILSFEIAVFYYAFGFRKTHQLQKNEFSTYKDSGVKAILWALLLAIFAETLALHFILTRWNTVAAFVLSGISIYTAIQVIAIIRSLTYCPIQLKENNLLLRFGILQTAEIPYKLIETVATISDDELQEFKGAKMSLMNQNIVLKLSDLATVKGFYGFEKTAKEICFFADGSTAFIENLEIKLSELKSRS